ncbi:flagellin, partial [Opitutales bacterium]|nr:flagellin [Opitutales bacterium]
GADGAVTGTEILFDAEDTLRSMDNTIDIFTSGEGSAGSKVSIHKSALLSALTLQTDKTLAGSVTNSAQAAWTAVVATQTTNNMVTFAANEIANTLDLDDISVGVITQALENISYLRAQSGGSQSRLAFNLESLTQQKTNMRAALGRIVDVDIAEESTNLAKYSILNQAAASMLAQANASSDVALLLLR